MKKGLTIFCCVLLVLSLAGCGREDPYRVNTVVRIPVDPTEAPTEQTGPVTEVPEESAEETTEESTEEVPEETKSSGGKKPSSSGNKKPSGSGSKETEPARTEPPATEAPAAEPEATKPEATEPEATQPQETEPEATEPEVTEPETTVPEETEPETTEPEETEGTYDPSDYTIGSLEYAILDEINAYRTEAGLPELTISTRLSGIAAIRAEEISRVWSHTRPDGRHYTSAMSDYGYGYGVSAENLIYASGSGDAAAMVAKWMSADNKDSLLSASFTTAGIGVYRSGGVTYVANLLIG